MCLLVSINLLSYRFIPPGTAREINVDMIEKMLKEKVGAFFYMRVVAQWCSAPLEWCSAPLEIEEWLSGAVLHLR